MYSPLHEADLSKFADAADAVLARRLMHKNIDDAIDSMYQIERTLLRRKLERSLLRLS